jgi:hypothetical protein
VKTKRAAFWLAVGGVSILANFAVELAAQKFPNLGLARFVEFTHRGPGGAS